MDDAGLLKKFRNDNDQDAFRKIVEHHSGMVFRACVRDLGDENLAQDAAQAVFIILAGKASKVKGKALSSFLFNTSRLVAKNIKRGEVRRKKRESEAAEMKNNQNISPDAETDWKKLKPVLNDAVDRLGREKDAVIRHYLEGKPHRTVAQELGCSEGAVKMRVSRGLRKLKDHMRKKGALVPAAALTALLASRVSGSVPGSLTESCVSVSMAALAGNTGGIGPLVSIAEGVNRMMIMAKITKAAAVIFSVLALVGGGVLLTVQLQADEAVQGEAGNTELSVKAQDTALGRLAASLRPGEMKKLKTIGLNRKLTKSWYDWDTIEDGVRKYGAQHMFSIMGGGWANDAKWDPKTEQIFFLAGGHYAAFKFVTYSAKTNTWTLEPVPPWLDPRSKSQDCGRWPKTKAGNKSWPRGHTYDCNAIFPEKRLYALTLWHKLRLYDIDKKKWLKSVPGFKTNSRGPCEGFPELSGFVAMNRAGKLCLYDLDKGKQKELGRVPFGIHGVMEYNRVHKVLIVGGGDSGKNGTRALSLVDAKGKIKRLKNLPVRVNCTPTSKLMCDPVSGEYIFQEKRQRNMKRKQKVYALHPILNEWKEMKRRFPTGVAVAVDTYGVIVILTDGVVFVYKHKPVWPD